MSAVLPGPTPPGRLVSRFAPSPTGELHLGNARTALFSLLLARRAGGRFLLRIEDTDRERSQEVHDAALLADLHWLGIDWDAGPDREDGHGPYRQSQRAALYAQVLRAARGAGCGLPVLLHAPGAGSCRAARSWLRVARRATPAPAAT